VLAVGFARSESRGQWLQEHFEGVWVKNPRKMAAVPGQTL